MTGDRIVSAPVGTVAGLFMRVSSDKFQFTDQKLVESLAPLCVFGDNIAVHSAEIGAVIGLFMCIW